MGGILILLVCLWFVFRLDCLCCELVVLFMEGGCSWLLRLGWYVWVLCYFVLLLCLNFVWRSPGFVCFIVWFAFLFRFTMWLWVMEWLFILGLFIAVIVLFCVVALVIIACFLDCFMLYYWVVCVALYVCAECLLLWFILLFEMLFVISFVGLCIGYLFWGLLVLCCLVVVGCTWWFWGLWVCACVYCFVCYLTLVIVLWIDTRACLFYLFGQGIDVANACVICFVFFWRLLFVVFGIVGFWLVVNYV